jgi:hypothetical protein
MSSVPIRIPKTSVAHPKVEVPNSYRLTILYIFVILKFIDLSHSISAAVCPSFGRHILQCNLQGGCDILAFYLYIEDIITRAKVLRVQVLVSFIPAFGYRVSSLQLFDTSLNDFPNIQIAFFFSLQLTKPLRCFP